MTKCSILTQTRDGGGSEMRVIRKCFKQMGKFEYGLYIGNY